MAIQESSLLHQEEEQRRLTRELEAEERGERQNSHNKQAEQVPEQSLKEKGKTKQLEDRVDKDEQLAVTPPPPPPLEEHNNISSRPTLDEDNDEQGIIWESLKDKGQTKQPSEDEVKGDGKLVEVIPPPR